MKLERLQNFNINFSRNQKCMQSAKSGVAFLGYNEFMNSIQMVYGDTPIRIVLSESLNNEDNKIGEGTTKTVYKIPFIENYVAAKLKSKTLDLSKPIENVENPSLKHNYGLPVASNNSGVLILEKVEGQSHLTHDWGLLCNDARNDNLKISADDAKAFLEGIQKIEKFPIESYVDLAQKVKCLSDNGRKMDSLSPNNILIDDENQKFNCIDLISTGFSEKLDVPLNNTYDLINALCGSILYIDFYNEMNSDQKESLKTATIGVIKKCMKAAQKTGLDLDYKKNCKFITEGTVFLNRGREFTNKTALIENHAEFCEMHKATLFENQNVDLTNVRSSVLEYLREYQDKKAEN